MKNIAFFFLALSLSATLVTAQVAVVKLTGVAAYDDARNGFASICFEDKREFVLEDNLSNQADATSQIHAGNFKLVVAIGPEAAAFAKNNLSDMPLVFLMVSDPLKGANITGVYNVVGIREQFTVLRSISKKAKRIGVIYTQPANDALIASARQVASEMNMDLVAASISSKQDIEKAMTQVVGKCDILWIPPDPSLASDEVIRYVGSTSLSKQLPCIGPNERYVRSGAIFSLSVDPIEAGRIAGDMANKILQGTPASRVPVQGLQKSRMILNLRAAGLLGLNVPKTLQDSASKIYQ